MTQAEQFKKELLGYFNAYKRDVFLLRALEIGSDKRKGLLFSLEKRKQILEEVVGEIEGILKEATQDDNNSI